MNLSASQLSMYRHCPAAYKFKYIDGIPEVVNEFSEIAFAFGREFHENVPMLISNDENIVKMIDALYESDYKNIINGKNITFEDCQVIEMLGANIKAILDGNSDDTILEFKTSKDFWTEDKFKEELQSVVYQTVELIRTGIEKRFIYFIVTKPYGWKKPQVQIRVINKISNEKKELLESLICNLKNDFEFNPTAYKRNDCFFCSYKDHCPTQF